MGKRILEKFVVVLEEICTSEVAIIEYDRGEHTDEMNLALDALLAMADD